MEAGRFTKGTFTGADVNIEALVPESVTHELTALGHEVTVVPPRTVLRLPKNYVKGTPIPAVVWLHGWGSHPDDFVDDVGQRFAE